MNPLGENRDHPAAFGGTHLRDSQLRGLSARSAQPRGHSCSSSPRGLVARVGAHEHKAAWSLCEGPLSSSFAKEGKKQNRHRAGKVTMWPGMPAPQGLQADPQGPRRKEGLGVCPHPEDTAVRCPQAKAGPGWAESRGGFRWRPWRGCRMLPLKTWVRLCSVSGPRLGVRAMEAESPVRP